MKSIYYYCFIIPLLILIVSIGIPIKHNLFGGCYWFYIYLVYNAIVMSYWYAVSLSWNDRCSIKDSANNLIEVDTYTFNPFIAEFKAWDEGTKKDIVLDELTEEQVLESHLGLSFVFFSLINMLYILVYALITFIGNV